MPQEIIVILKKLDIDENNFPRVNYELDDDGNPKKMEIK